LADQEPKDAASVLLLRRPEPGEKNREGSPDGSGGNHPGAPDLEVYMIRREESLRFLGGYYAFPGGHVDQEDYEMVRNLRCCEKLKGPPDPLGFGERGRPGGKAREGREGSTHFFARRSGEEESRAADGRSPEPGLDEKAAAHQVAAIRELYEECGVLLARPAAGVHPDRSGQGAFPAALRDRALLLAGQIRFCQILDRAGLRPDLEALSFLDRWVTPEGLPIRYDTKFYTAWMPEDQQPDPYAGEASWGGWVRPQTALHDADSGRIPMVFSTMACLWKLMEL
jgi:8-oxo-dGTP pyrophosphatase MutT (NUDIX family)